MKNICNENEYVSVFRRNQLMEMNNFQNRPIIYVESSNSTYNRKSYTSSIQHTKEHIIYGLQLRQQSQKEYNQSRHYDSFLSKKRQRDDIKESIEHPIKTLP